MKGAEQEYSSVPAACRRFEAELSAYLEGEDRPLVLEHAEICEFCRCVLADLELVRAMSTEALAEPSEAVWTHIRAALVAENIIREPAHSWRQAPSRTRRWFSSPIPAFGSAAVVIAILAAAFMLHSPRSSAPSFTQNSASQITESAAILGSPAPQTIQQLQQMYDANENSIEPSLKATYQRSLQSLDEEIRECQQSLEQQPDNALAGEYLSSAYAEKAQLLQSALEYNLR